MKISVTKMSKERLDVLLVQRGFAASREKAKAFIMSGDVYVDGQKEDKAGHLFDEDCVIEVKADKMPYVSRGGFKLEKAIDVFGISLEGLVCMDAGASTGGFTDCMLQNGAKKVYSVDVGYGQLDWSLRNDPRVVCMEKTNVRYIKPDMFDERPEFASADVSFISLTKILVPVRDVLSDEACMVCLIKPQFEAGREQVGKHGVVRDNKVHVQVIRMITDFVSKNGFVVCGLDFSPIKGPEGNIEYLLFIRKSDSISSDNVFGIDINKVVDAAHEVL